MRLFENCAQAYPEILRDIIKFGRTVKTKTQQDMFVGDTDQWHSKEITGYSFAVVDDSDCIEQSAHPEWVKDEIIERTNAKAPFINPGTNYLKRKEYWEKYGERNGLGELYWNYSYNERIGPYLDKLVHLLKTDPFSRQAVLSIWNQDIDHKDVLGRGRIPCSMWYQFLIREGKMENIYTMRSCDYYEHFRNDYALAVLIKRWMAEQLGIECGMTTMFIGSLHIYKKDAVAKEVDGLFTF